MAQIFKNVQVILSGIYVENRLKPSQYNLLFWLSINYNVMACHLSHHAAVTNIR